MISPRPRYGGGSSPPVPPWIPDYVQHPGYHAPDFEPKEDEEEYEEEEDE